MTQKFPDYPEHCTCNDCLSAYIKSLPKPKKSKAKPKKPKKKEPPAKCGLCRRRLIPGDPGDYCMTCRYRMDNAGR